MKWVIEWDDHQDGATIKVFKMIGYHRVFVKIYRGDPGKILKNIFKDMEKGDIPTE